MLCWFLLPAVVRYFGIIILIFTVHANGKAFGGIRDIMSLLHNDYQKVINDVSDVKDTIDCTVNAVENALTLGSTPLNPKCKVAVNEYQDVYERLKRRDKQKEISLGFLHGSSFGHDFENLNTSINNQIEFVNRKGIENQQDLKYKLNVDDDRLRILYQYFRDELEKLSLRFKEFRTIKFYPKFTLDTIMKYMNLLQDVERNCDNESEIKEVRQILDGASKILSVDVKSGDSDDDKINKLITTLEHDSKREDIADGKNTLSKLAENKFPNDNHNNSHSSPTTFKDIVKILGTPVKENLDMKNRDRKIKEMAASQSIPIISPAPIKEKNINTVRPESLFGDRSDHLEIQDDALKEALEIFKGGRKTKSMFGNFFAQSDQLGSSVF